MYKVTFWSKAIKRNGFAEEYPLATPNVYLKESPSKKEGIAFLFKALSKCEQITERMIKENPNQWEVDISKQKIIESLRNKIFIRIEYSWKVEQVKTETPISMSQFLTSSNPVFRKLVKSITK